MDWQGIAQGLGNFGDILAGKESYNSIRDKQQAIGLARQKQAMDAHMQKENLQADLDKERMRTARENDLQRWAIGADDARQTKKIEADKSLESIRAGNELAERVQRDIIQSEQAAERNKALVEAARLRNQGAKSGLDLPLNPALAAQFGFPSGTLLREAQVLSGPASAALTLKGEVANAESYERGRKAAAELAKERERNSLWGRFKRSVFGDSQGTGIQPTNSTRQIND